jgi:hypothetical protein
MSISFYWKAKYLDGTELSQFDKNGEEHLFSEIKQENLDTFSWVPINASLPTYSIKLAPNQRLIALRRHRKHIKGGVELGEEVMYLLGWQMTELGKNFKSIMYICPDGNIILDSQDTVWG